MATTIFLFTLEPNLAILCVSVPMLRPFYVKYKKRMGGSRLQEYSDERSTGFRDQGQSGYGSSAQMASRPGEPSTWEMENYYPPGKAHHNATVSGFGDESGSEKDLTINPKIAKEEIKVETKWAVTHT